MCQRRHPPVGIIGTPALLGMRPLRYANANRPLLPYTNVSFDTHAHLSVTLLKKLPLTRTPVSVTLLKKLSLMRA